MSFRRNATRIGWLCMRRVWCAICAHVVAFWHLLVLERLYISVASCVVLSIMCVAVYCEHRSLDGLIAGVSVLCV